MRICRRLLAAGMVLACGAGQALSAEEQDQPGWGGEAELGFVSTAGNSDTQSFNARVALENDAFPWRHDVRLEVLHSEDNGDTTAERYVFAGKTDYRFDEHHYLFGTLRYEDDRFSGYDYRVSETFGYGRRVLDRPTVKLDLEAGAGGRHSIEVEGDRTDEGIVRVGGDFSWQISPTASFREELFVEGGESNTFTESVTGVKLKINSKLATKLSYTVRNSSDVPEGTDNTDSITAVTLVLDF